jgi:hypothetical protein
MLLILLATLFYLLVFDCKAFGATYYVSPTGDDDSTGLTLARAWEEELSSETEETTATDTDFSE